MFRLLQFHGELHGVRVEARVRVIQPVTAWRRDIEARLLGSLLERLGHRGPSFDRSRRHGASRVSVIRIRTLAT